MTSQGRRKLLNIGAAKLFFLTDHTYLHAHVPERTRMCVPQHRTILRVLFLQQLSSRILVLENRSLNLDDEVRQADQAKDN